MPVSSGTQTPAAHTQAVATYFIGMSHLVTVWKDFQPACAWKPFTFVPGSCQLKPQLLVVISEPSDVSWRSGGLWMCWRWSPGGCSSSAARPAVQPAAPGRVSSNSDLCGGGGERELSRVSERLNMLLAGLSGRNLRSTPKVKAILNFNNKQRKLTLSPWGQFLWDKSL